MFLVLGSWFLVLSSWLSPSFFVRQSGGGEGALAGEYHFGEITWAEGVKKRGT